jgi:hypothetical protein
MQIANLPVLPLQRPGRALPASSVSTARSCDRPCPERPIDPAIDCVDSSMSATAALSMSITCLCRPSYLVSIESRCLSPLVLDLLEIVTVSPFSCVLFVHLRPRPRPHLRPL